MESSIYLIVEGLTDVRYLGQLLGPLLKESYKLLFYNAGGYNAMLTSVRPIIDQVPVGSKVLFLFDADTMNQESAEERLTFFKEQIGPVRKACKIGVYYFLPEIEDVIMGNNVSYVSQKNMEVKEIVDYIDQNRSKILSRKPLSDIIDFIKDTNA